MIYHSDGRIPGEVTLSPDARYASFVEVRQSEAGPRQRLVIIDIAGDVVRVVEQEGNRGIREHTWCCGAGKVAILSGAIAEAATFTPANVSVLDVRTGGRVPLEGIWRPQQIHWARFDSSLYIKGAPPPEAQGKPGYVAWPVYRYHLPSGRLSTTTRRGIFFSPDGRYYFGSVAGEFGLYRTADDQDVTAALRLPREQVRRGPPGGWMPGADHALHFMEEPVRQEPRPGEPPELARRTPDVPRAYPDRWNLAVDAETGRVIDRIQGDPGGWKTNAPALPVERRTGVELVPPRHP